MKNKNYTGAVEDFEKASLIEPNDSEAYYALAIAEARLDQYEKALINYNKTVELNPDNAGAYYNRALLKVRLSNYKLALEDANKAQELYETYTDLSGIKRTENLLELIDYKINNP